MTTLAAEASHAAPRRQASTVQPWHWALFALVVLLVIGPLTLLVLGSFSLATLPTDFSIFDLTTENYEELWGDPTTFDVVGNTVIYVIGATTIGATLAVALAWLVERTNLPGKSWIYAGIPLTLAIPSMLQAMAWVLLLSPRIGFLNKLSAPLGLGPVNIYSLGGMIFVEGLRLVPTAFLMLVPLMHAMDPALEEAAAMSGAGPARTLTRVTSRLLLPGLLAIVIYIAMTALEIFEVPGILGLPAGIYVFSTKIYALVNSTTLKPNYGEASVLAMVYLLIALVATWAYGRVIVRSERFAVITGKGYRPNVIDLGAWRPLALAGVLLYLTLVIFLPFLVLLFASLMPYVQTPSLAAIQTATLANYQRVMSTGLIGTVLWNTILLVVATSTLTVLLSFAIAMVVVRSKFPFRRLLDQLAFLPHAIPGIVLGLAFLWIFLNADKAGVPIHGGIIAMTIAFSVGYMAYSTRAMNAAILQVHKDLEEAAYANGASVWRTMWRVFFPLLRPTFVGVWIWVMLHVVRAAGTPLILYEGQQNQVLAILVWNMWDEGYIEPTAALGTLMILFLMLMTLMLRAVGFGRGAMLRGT